MTDFSTSIGNCPVTISIGNMIREKADAYMIPQFHDNVVIGGVAGAVANAGAMTGMLEFKDFMEKNGPLDYGTVWPQKSYGGNSEWLMNAISVCSGKDTAFDVIRKVTYETMKACADKGADSIILPALGTGALRELTPEQSALAMLSGIHQYASEGGKPVTAKFVFLNNGEAQDLFDAYKKVLQTKAYETAASQTAEAKVDFGRWAAMQEIDAAANDAFARQNPVGSGTTTAVKLSKPLKFKPQGGAT